MSNNGIKFCAQCGTSMEEEASFCPKCGAPVEEPVAQESPEKAAAEETSAEQAPTEQQAAAEQAPTEQQVAAEQASAAQDTTDQAKTGQGTVEQPVAEQAPKKEPAAKKEKKNGKLGVVVGIAAALVVVIVAVIGLVAVLASKGSGSKDTAQQLIYLKDNELMTVTGSRNTPLFVSDKYYANKDDYSLSAYYSMTGLFSGLNIRFNYPVQYTEDGKYMFYPKKMNNGRYDLYYRKTNGKAEDEEKQDSDVIIHTVVSKNTVVYLKGDDRKLYISDMKDKEKLADDVVSYWVTDNGRYVIWTQRDDDQLKLYVQDTKKSEKTKIDTIDSLIDHSEDCSVLVYYKNGDVCVCRDFKDKETVAKDVLNVYTYNIDDKLEMYYVKESDKEYTLYDMFSDEKAEEDEAMVEPDITDYQTVTIEDGYWGPREVVETDDAYYDALDRYYKKVSRDSVREELKNSDAGIYEQELYYYVLGKDEATQVVQFTGDVMDTVYGDSALLCYAEIDMEQLGGQMDISVFLEENYYDIMDEMEAIIGESASVKLVAGESVKELKGLDLDETEDIAIYLNKKTNELYVEEATVDGDINLYTWNYRKDGTECELLTEDVYSIVMSLDDGIYYTADANSSGDSADLYLNGDKLDSDVYPYSVMKEDGTLLYMKDIDSQHQEGTLYCRQKNKSVKIADDVALGFYGVVKGGKVAYLTDYNFRRYRGDLMLFDGKNSSQIDTDVTCIFFGM